MTSIRQPAVAGQFYEGTESALRQQIDSVFRHEHGPGEIPAVRDGPPAVLGLVSPHAGYPYSGPVAAHGFGVLARSGTPDAAIVLGPNHDGVGIDAALSGADRWETPLGTVPVHDDLTHRIAAATDAISVDERTHQGEHSIEVQVPFIQYFYDDSVPIVPICFTRQDPGLVSDVSEAVVDAVEATGLDVVLVSSTDLTHYQPQDVASEQDSKAIDQMEALDGSGLLDTVRAENISMCGYGPTASVLDAASALGAMDGQLLKYATSGDTAGPSREVVGYASVMAK
ncbi:MAG: AmmeMemoRadiSam system protein B [Halodesulfurarchaeum sp.]